jgi:hypothetical protein
MNSCIKRALYSMLNSPVDRRQKHDQVVTENVVRPLPCVTPRSALEYPNMSFKATSAVAVNSSSRTSLSMMSPRRLFRLPMTAPACPHNFSSHPTLLITMIGQTLEFDRCNHFHLHDRLQDDRTRCTVSFAECSDGSKPKRKLRGIDRVMRAIFQDEAATSHWISRQRALFQSFKKTLGR